MEHQISPECEVCGKAVGADIAAQITELIRNYVITVDGQPIKPPRGEDDD